MKKRIKGLNRRIFKRNLKEVLRKDLKDNLKYTFEYWVNDYEKNTFFKIVLLVNMKLSRMKHLTKKQLL